MRQIRRIFRIHAVADARIRNDDIRHPVARHEVARRRPQCQRIAHVDSVAMHGVRMRQRGCQIGELVAASADQSENGALRRVMTGERLAQPARGAGDEDLR